MTGHAPRFAFLDAPLPLAFAHRGGGLEGPENSLEAFSHAVSLGYRYLETDVQASRDGVAVLHHDATLKRLFGRDTAVAQLDWPELSQLRCAEGTRLVRLDALLEAFPEARLNLDLKSDAAVPAVASVVRRHNALERVCAGSFDPRRTRCLRQRLGPDLCWSPGHLGVALVWLAGWGLPLPAPRCGALQVPTHFHGVRVVTPRLIAAAHARGLQVHVWTVDDTAEMARLLDIGVDGLMTDRPSVLKALLQERGQWTGV